jgi:hypothetical protein
MCIERSRRAVSTGVISVVYPPDTDDRRLYRAYIKRSGDRNELDLDLD